MSMKIVCVIDSLGPGGAQRQLVGLALGFIEKGHSISFLTYHQNTFFKNVLDKAGIIVTCIQSPGYFSRLIKMRNFIRNGKFDAVLSFLEAPTFICEVAGLPKRNWILVAGERNANPKISRSLKLILYRWFHLLADYIVANSLINLQLVQSVNPFLQEKKCKVNYNIIDFSRWKPDPDYIITNGQKLKISIAASHCYRKNLIGLVQALSLLEKQELSRIHIEWYGDPINPPCIDNSFTEASHKIREYGLERVISFYPATHDITGIIQRSDVVGLFSFYEGLPNIVCEGMACGKPIICSAVSDLPVLLSHEPNLMCDPYEPQSIKQALRYLIMLTIPELTQIGLKNLSIAREKFEKELIVNQYLNLFNR